MKRIKHLFAAPNTPIVILKHIKDIEDSFEEIIDEIPGLSEPKKVYTLLLNK